MKGLTLTQKEQARLQVLNGILEGQISVDEAAEVLGVSERHVWRILAEYRKGFPSIEEAKDFVESFRPWELFGTQGVTVDPGVRPALDSATTV